MFERKSKFRLSLHGAGFLLGPEPPLTNENCMTLLGREPITLYFASVTLATDRLPPSEAPILFE